jgi:hypothetical protein
MNKKRIARPTRGMSWHHTAKSTGLLVEVNATVVPGSNAFLPGEIPRRKCRGKSAEAIVVSREPGAGKCPLKHEHRKTRAHEGLNWSVIIRPCGGGTAVDPEEGRSCFVSPRREAWDGQGELLGVRLTTEET